uniref:Uncharacterized protein n=1 Tax=Meloidogyne incognita TaxID=6306 RepID=A0A914MFD7_MELIC
MVKQTTSTPTTSRNSVFRNFEQRFKKIENLLLQIIPENNSDNEQPLARLEKRLDKLEKLVHSVVASLKQQNVGQNSNLTTDFTPQTTNTISPWGCPPDLIIRHVNAAMLDREIIEEKSKRAVLEKVPENIDEKEVIKSIVEKCGLENELIEEDIHRHPRQKSESNNKSRIIKIPFRTVKARNTFLKTYRKALKNLPNIPKFISARRDMTMSELSILYNLRSKAYAENQKCGQYKYVVNDLSIKELPNPKPFKTHA